MNCARLCGLLPSVPPATSRPYADIGIIATAEDVQRRIAAQRTILPSVDNGDDLVRRQTSRAVVGVEFDGDLLVAHVIGHGLRGVPPVGPTQLTSRQVFWNSFD